MTTGDGRRWRMIQTALEREAARKRKDPRLCYDFLEERTGWSAGVWMVRIQEAIGKASGPPRKRGKYKGHSSTDARAWVREIVEQVIRDAGILKRKDRDENMGMAATLGIVLVAWYARVHRAKAFDPRRPIAHRKRALEQVNRYVLEVVKAMTVECFDPAVFKDQEWENPWHPKARDGKFV